MNAIKFQRKGLDKKLSAYIDSGYTKVEGWGINDDLIDIFLAIDDLQKKNGLSGNVAEIGVHHGRVFILYALLISSTENAIALDLFEDQLHNIDKSGQGNLGIFKNNIIEHIGSLNNISIHKADTLFLKQGALDELKDCRMFHVDGGHWPDIVANDIKIAENSMRPGGCICIDDMMHSGFPGVMEGVFRYFSRSQSTKLRPFAIGMNKLFLTTYSYHDFYITALGKLIREPRGRVVEFLGNDCICLDPH